MGFPIRKSADQSLFAAPRGLSQRTTSFIACACQGIHRTPLSHLIALIIDARPFQDLAIRERNGRHSQTRPPQSTAELPASPRTALRTSDPPPSRQRIWKDQCHTRTARRRGGQASPAFARPPDWANVRTTLLFTMSANRQHSPTGNAANPCLSRQSMSNGRLAEP